jgi:hypothetical protein
VYNGEPKARQARACRLSRRATAAPASPDTTSYPSPS